MSCYSDWKAGYLSDDEYKGSMRRECEDIDVYDRFGCCDCSSYKECCLQVIKEGYPQCDEGAEQFEDEAEVHEALQDNEFLMATYNTVEKEDIISGHDVLDILYDWQAWKKE